MRTLKLQVQATIDGYIAGPNGEQDWMTSNWDSELEEYVEAITEPVDCIVLGRKLAEGFIPYWTSVAENSNDPQFEAGKTFTNIRKVVFTRTLDESRWENTVLAKGDLADEITKLKTQDGGDIIAYGGADFVSNLIKREVIDAFHLFINLVAIGTGMTIFEKLDDKQNMTLVTSRSLQSGYAINAVRRPGNVAVSDVTERHQTQTCVASNVCKRQVPYTRRHDEKRPVSPKASGSVREQRHIAEHITDDVRWTIVGDRAIQGKEALIEALIEMQAGEPMELTIEHVITHGRMASVNGTITTRSGSGEGKAYAFCDVYALSGFKNPRIKAMTSYVIEVEA